MKRYIPFLLVLAACTNESDTSVKIELDDSDTITQVVDTLVIQEEEKPSRIDSLISNPLDLVAFKEAWGPSHSGGSTGAEFLELPSEEGRLLRFMNFYNLRQVLPGRPNEGELFKKFSLTVYRFVKDGESTGDFFDTNETLLKIECALDNTKLGELNWFGKTKVNVMDLYGVPTYEQDDCIIYESEDGVISAHLTDGEIDWYKYAKLNKELDLSIEIPEFLLEY